MPRIPIAVYEPSDVFALGEWREIKEWEDDEFEDNQYDSRDNDV